MFRHDFDLANMDASPAFCEVIFKPHPQPMVDSTAAEESYELTTPSHTDNLDLIRDFVAEAAAKAGLGETALLHLEIAVEEACVNAIKHAHKNDETKPLRLQIKTNRQKLTVLVIDQGEGFDPAGLKPWDMKEYLTNLRPGGLGIQMMKMLMDEVHFERQQGNGMQVRLVKYFANASSEIIH